MRFGFHGKGILLCAAFVFACGFFPADGAQARRHDPKVPTRVSEEDGRRAKVSRVFDRRFEEAQGKRSEATVKDAEQAYFVPDLSMLLEDGILGDPWATEAQCVRYLLSVNPAPQISVSPEELVSYYYEEGRREGVRPDVAFAQALKETGYFRYGGTVTADQNNYCGLGTTSAEVKGAYFSSARMGVRAHIQHLLAYATTRVPKEEIIDPRYRLVRERYGAHTLPRWEDLNGRWAVPGDSYGQSILSLHRAILSR